MAEKKKGEQNSTDKFQKVIQTEAQELCDRLVRRTTLVDGKPVQTSAGEYARAWNATRNEFYKQKNMPDYVGVISSRYS